MTTRSTILPTSHLPDEGTSGTLLKTNARNNFTTVAFSAPAPGRNAEYHGLGNASDNCSHNRLDACNAFALLRSLCNMFACDCESSSR